MTVGREAAEKMQQSSPNFASDEKTKSRLNVGGAEWMFDFAVKKIRRLLLEN